MTPPREIAVNVTVTDLEAFRELGREVIRLRANEAEAHRLALLVHESWEPGESQPSRDLYHFILDKCGPSCD